MAIEGIITKARALESLQRTIGHVPNYVYNPDDRRTCRYVNYSPDDGRPLGPSDAVGQALYAEGLELEVLVAADQGEYLAASEFHLYREFSMTFGAARVFEAAQRAQDNGDTWGGALLEAERAAIGAPEDNPGRCPAHGRYQYECECFQ